MAGIERPIVDLKDEWSRYDGEHWTPTDLAFMDVSSEEAPGRAGNFLLRQAADFATEPVKGMPCNGKSKGARDRRLRLRRELIEHLMNARPPCCMDCGRKLVSRHYTDMPMLALRDGAPVLVCKQCIRNAKSDLREQTRVMQQAARKQRQPQPPFFRHPLKSGA